jgi:acyl-CoA thioester hydrolase
MSSNPDPEAALRPHDTPVRVRYGEVDRMGFLYHGHYLAYFEQGRTEMLRSLGATYRELEEQGTLLVVVETGQRFLRPAGYDDHLTIRTTLTEVRGVRVRFDYEVRRDEDLLATGHTVLASCNSNGRPRRMPSELRSLLGPDRRKIEQPGDVQGAAS